MGPRLGSRGDAGHHAELLLALHASMGPRLGSRGDQDNTKRLIDVVKLQWGRGWVAAETTATLCCTSRPTALQWGRGWVAAETAKGLMRLNQRGTASMGPRLGSRGDIRPATCWLPMARFNGAAAG